MATPDVEDRAGSSVRNAGPLGSEHSTLRTVPTPPILSKGKNQNIRVSPVVLDAARKDAENLFRDLRTSLSGLTESEAEERARTTGPNEVAQERKQGWLVRLLKIIRNPLVILLTALSVISFLTGDPRAGSVMAGMVALSVGLRFWQEARADSAAQKLKAMIHVTAAVVRDGKAREIPLRELVPGDIVKLAAGDMIPGDVRLLSSKDLFVSQGSLTGESLPVEKFHDPETIAEISPIELKNICFMGTSVESGTAIAVVVTTGVQTYFGSMAHSITGERVQTSVAHDEVYGGDGATGVFSSTVSPSTIGRERSSSRWLWPWGSLQRCCL
jgi:P-type Mg2+ transporter